MIRNAGGRAIDSIRSLAVLQTIGNHGTIVVMHHTGKQIIHGKPVAWAEGERRLAEIS